MRCEIPLSVRMESYESKEASRIFTPFLPIVVMLDGHDFSSYTKNLDKPFDERMVTTMQDTTKQLVAHVGADIGYTQSDEITLIFINDSDKSQPFLEGRIQKTVSVLASACTIYFNTNALINMPGAHAGKIPMFDCRAFQTPSLTEACNALIWRQQDAKRHSIRSAACSRFSRKECAGKDQEALLCMLSKVGIEWDNYPSKFKYGTWFGKESLISKESSSKLI